MERSSFRVPTWDNMPTVTGAMCARALQRAGFDVRLDGPDHMTVCREGIALIRIPLLDELRRELVVGIAKTAGLTAEEFIRYLEA